MRKFLALLVCTYLGTYVFGQSIEPAGTSSICQGETLELSAKDVAAARIIAWLHSVDNGATYTNTGKSTLTFDATEAGRYRLVFRNGNQDDTTGHVTVRVNEKPTVNFSFPPNGCAGSPIGFTSTVSGGTPPYTYSWSFDDGKTATAANPQHTFEAFGCGTQSFNVRLSVTDKNGCVNVISKPVLLKQNPRVELDDVDQKEDPFRNCDNGNVNAPNYTIRVEPGPDNSTTCFTTYTINWGDGTSQNGIPAGSFPLSHTYTQQRVYDMVVSATGTNGCTTSKTYKVINQSNPAVGISGPGSTTGCAPIGFTFNLNAYKSNSAGTRYEWNFGDGSPTVSWNTPVPTDTIFHVFGKTSCNELNREFVVSVTASNGCKSTTATVNNISITEKPKADFTAPLTACRNTPVNFTNNSIPGYAGSNCNRIANYEWDFGDGTSGSTNENPSHSYNTPGTYTIRLIAGSGCGKDTAFATICVTPNPAPAFTVNAATGCAPFTMTTTNTSPVVACSPTSFRWSVAYTPSNCGLTPDWDFVTGSTETSASPSFRFDNPGTYTVTLTATNSCGTFTSNRIIIVKQPPTVSIAGIPNACGPVTIQPVASVTNCGTGTLTYDWTFEGGNPATSTLLNPGAVSFSTPGAHKITLIVKNECGATTATQTFNINPVPDVKIPGNQPYCPGETVPLLNFTGSLPNTTYSWTNSNTFIGLAASGNNATIPAFTTTNIGSTPITATIDVHAVSNGCVNNSSYTITVNPRPAAPVAPGIGYCQNAVAAPLSATALSGHTLQWYTSASGGTASPAAPTPVTSNVGTTTYYVSQVNAANCEGPRTPIAVSISPTPVITNATSSNPATCSGTNGFITLIGLSPNVPYTIRYQRNGAPQTQVIMSTANGTVIIPSLPSGTYSGISASVGGCISNEMGPFTLTDPLPPVSPTVTSNSPVCSGTTLKLTSASTTAGAVQYSWTGPNGFTSNLQNPEITAVGAAAAGTYTVVATLNGCVSTATVQVQVNVRPQKPVANSVVYCLDATATALTASVSAGNQLKWYDNASLLNGSATAPVPATTTAGTVYYYVTQTGTNGCESDTARVAVVTYPAIASNTIASDQVICAGSVPSTLSGGAPTGGIGVYTYQWQSSIDNGSTWTNIIGAVSSNYSPAALNADIQYRRVVSSGPCSGQTSNEVTISVQGGLTGIDITGPQTICAGTAPLLLKGGSPTGGSGNYTYQWQSSINGVDYTDIVTATGADYQPGVLRATTYYRRKINSGSCATVSAAVMITVNPLPVLNAIADVVTCNSSSVNIGTFTSMPATGTGYAWSNDNSSIGLAASGNGNLPSFTATNTGKIPVKSTISVLPTYTNNSVACPGAALDFSITVLPTIAIAPIPDKSTCTGSILSALTPEHDAGAFAGSDVSYQWTVTGSGISLANGSGVQLPSYTAINNGSTDLVATVTITPVYSFGGKSCNGTQASFKVTVKPGTPQAAAGRDIALCAATQYSMQAVLPATATGSWKQIAGQAVSISNPASPVTNITGLQTGQTYRFEWTVNGFAECPPTKDTVEIINYSALVNTIDNAAQTICFGQSVSITGQAATGGNDIHVYQWQTSSDGTNWTDLPGQTAQSITFSPQANGFIRRVVRSLPCSSESLPVAITVQPGVQNNTITANQEICINTAAAILKGSAPTGGNGTFIYQWERSVDNGASWSTIVSAVGIDYNPGVLTQTTSFRRKVSTSLCTGPQQSTSNEIVITVRPDASAEMSPIDTIGCVPFNITAAMMQMQHLPERNGQYQWFVDGQLVGQGINFPGYSMNNSNDTILVMLKAISRYGCKDDSIAQRFYTFKVPQPAFTLSDTVGCGPLTVLVTNNTSDINAYRYSWNFGNGQVSSDPQPGTIIFQSNPTFGDTSYIVTLQVMSACETMTVRDTIRVKSKPKALFAPSATVGCSPMTVMFNNISLGLGNRYTWDFGDGTPRATSNVREAVSHTYITNVQDTFHARLIVVNECGSDTMQYAIVVSPNTIALDFAVNGVEQSGCAPHAVRFINNSKGATTFAWDFGDGNILNTTRNIDTITHIFQQSGKYTVTLRASNGCSDTSSTEKITVYPKPVAAFSIDQHLACIGDTFRFTNKSDSATSYQWSFGDGNVSSLVNPTQQYRTPGIYTVVLKIFRVNAPGSVCSDSISMPVTVVTTLPGIYTVSDSVGNCAPFTVDFENKVTPAASITWDFGDGHTATGNNTSHTYAEAGVYTATATVVTPQGCTYQTWKIITVRGPKGSFTYQGGDLCNEESVRFEATVSGTDSLIWNFGDGQTLRTTSRIVHHVYPHAGTYLPSLVLKSNSGCNYLLEGKDSIKVDKVEAGFTTVQDRICGSTTVQFRDTSNAFSGKALVRWNFGDGSEATGLTTSHTYTSSGEYTIRQIVTSNSGCTDTIIRQLNVHVNNLPVINLDAEDVHCSNKPLKLDAQIESIDSVNIIQWSLSNGVTRNTNPFEVNLSPGSYSIRLIVGTVNGCYDTAFHNVTVNPSPVVTASPDMNICRGNTVQLTSRGAPQLSWQPMEGLSCTDCASPIASPLTTTPYIVRGTNSFGCTDEDTVVVTVMQPFKMNVSGNDSICIGQSTQLLVSGASTYSWTPATGLSNTTISNPIASPTQTTTYRVVGYDGRNCFTDTAFITVAIGQYPTVNLGPDLTLASGTKYPLQTVVENGPIRTWSWTPSNDLTCANCPLPVAEIKKDINYIVKVTTPYGCSATDTLNIKAFCENTQVFVPNAFTPDGDGVNDILLVRGSGIVTVKYFRIFNRWGELVFERSNFRPNDPFNGWDGKVRGKVDGPGVYVYTADVICENGTSYTYKGNVSVIK